MTSARRKVLARREVARTRVIQSSRFFAIDIGMTVRWRKAADTVDVIPICGQGDGWRPGALAQINAIGSNIVACHYVDTCRAIYFSKEDWNAGNIEIVEKLPLVRSLQV